MLLSLQTRKKYDKSPTFKIYTTSIRLVSYVAVIYFGPQGQREQRRVNAAAAFLVTPPSGRVLVIPFFPWFLTPPSGRGLVIPFFFPWCFFWWSLAPDLRFSLVSYVAVIYFGPQGQREQRRINAAAAFLVTPPSGRGLVIPFFSVVSYPAVRTGSSNTVFFPWCFFWWSLAPDLRFSLGQRNTHHVFRYTAKGFYLE